MEKRLEMQVTMMVDNYASGLKVGDLMSELIENLGVLTDGVYAVRAEYTINGKERDEVQKHWI